MKSDFSPWASRTLWKCAKCQNENVGRTCAQCGLSKTKSDVLNTFDVKVEFGVYPVENLSKRVYILSASEIFYAGDCTYAIKPDFTVFNKSDTPRTASFVFVLNKEKTFSWGNKQIDAHDRYPCSAQYPLTVGSHSYTLYIDGVVVKEGTFVVSDGNSELFNLIHAPSPKLCDFSMSMQVQHTKLDVCMRSESGVCYMSSLEEDQEFEPKLTITNKSTQVMNFRLGCMINNSVTWIFDEQSIAPGKVHAFRWCNCPFSNGINEFVWYMNGIEVFRGTCEFYSDVQE